MHSIVNRTPPHLLEEILLLDDASDKEHLGQRLDDYMAKYDTFSQRFTQPLSFKLDYLGIVIGYQLNDCSFLEK